MHAVPLARQFEQVLNARYLELEGFGRKADTLNDAKTVLDFVASVPECEAKLANYTQDGNTEIQRAIDEWLDKAAAGVP
jgi:hypothetical protein